MATQGTWALTNPSRVRKRIRDYFEGLKRYEFKEVYEPDLGEKVWTKIEVEPRTPGVAGLAAHLGINRMTYFNYCRRSDEEMAANPELAEIVRALRQAKTLIEAAQEQALFDKDRHRGAAFSLSVNFRWKDETDGDGGEHFVQKIIPPPAEPEQRAIAKWEPDDEE